VAVDTQTVTLAGKATQNVIFTVSQTEAGNYIVDVGAQSRFFTVAAASPPVTTTTTAPVVTPPTTPTPSATTEPVVTTPEPEVTTTVTTPIATSIGSADAYSSTNWFLMGGIVLATAAIAGLVIYLAVRKKQQA
jgi:hypothetical protein